MKKILLTLFILIPSFCYSNSSLNMDKFFLNHFTSTHNDRMGLYPEFIQAEFNNQTISYQYQSWKIKHKSVCANHKKNLLELSSCSQAAKQLFIEVCKHAQLYTNQEKIVKKIKNMYCTAAIDYKPVVATLTASGTKATPLSKAREMCLALSKKAKLTQNHKVIEQRDKACSIYGKMKK